MVERAEGRLRTLSRLDRIDLAGSHPAPRRRLLEVMAARARRVSDPIAGLRACSLTAENFFLARHCAPSPSGKRPPSGGGFLTPHNAASEAVLARHPRTI